MGGRPHGRVEDEGVGGTNGVERVELRCGQLGGCGQRSGCGQLRSTGLYEAIGKRLEVRKKQRR